MLDPDAIAGMPEAIAAIYSDAEQQLIAKIARSLSKGLGTPEWAATQLAAVNQLAEAARGDLFALTPEVTAQLQQFIGQAALAGETAAASDVAAAESIEAATPGTPPPPAVKPAMTTLAAPVAAPAAPGVMSAAPIISQAAVEALAAEVVGKITGTHAPILRSVTDTYRSIVAEVAGRTVTGTATTHQILQQALNRFADHGIDGIVTGGRRWRIDTYAEMATRTATMRALQAGHTQKLMAAGRDLVVVSSHANSAPQCAPYQGKILSLSGSTSGTVTMTNRLTGEPMQVRVFTSMHDAENHGLHHPNCGHRHTLFVPGASRPMPEPYDAERYDNEQKLRYHERQARDARGRQSVAITPEAKAKADQLLAARLQRLEDHVAATGTPRRRYRERLRIGKPGETAPQTKLVPLPPKPKPKPARPKPHELDDAQLDAAITKAQAKVNGLKSTGLGGMQAHSDLLLLKYQRRVNRADAGAEVEMSSLEALAWKVDQAGDAVLSATSKDALDAAKVQLAQAKKGLQAQLSADWLAAEQRHTQKWLDAESSWKSNVGAWLDAEQKHTADVLSWLDAENQWKSDVDGWLAAEQQWGDDVNAWLSGEQKHHTGAQVFKLAKITGMSPAEAKLAAKQFDDQAAKITAKLGTVDVTTPEGAGMSKVLNTRLDQVQQRSTLAHEQAKKPPKLAPGEPDTMDGKVDHLAGIIENDGEAAASKVLSGWKLQALEQGGNPADYVDLLDAAKAKADLTPLASADQLASLKAKLASTGTPTPVDHAATPPANPKALAAFGSGLSPAGLQKQIDKLTVQLGKAKNPYTGNTMPTHAKKLVLEHKLAGAGDMDPATEHAHNLLAALEQAAYAKSAGATAAEIAALTSKATTAKKHLQAALKAKGDTPAPVTAAVGEVTAHGLPASFDATFDAMVAAKKVKDWSTYDPMKALWADTLDISPVELNAAINDHVFGGMTADDVKAKLGKLVDPAKAAGADAKIAVEAKKLADAAANAAKSAAEKKAKADAAAKAAAEAAKDDPLQNLKAYNTVSPDRDAPEGTSDNPRTFPGQTGRTYGQARWKPKSWYPKRNVDAANWYSGSAYTQINKALWDSAGAKHYDPKRGAALDEFFDVAPQPDEWMVVSRGARMIDFGLAEGDDPTSIIGKVKRNDGYTSTSMAEQPAFGGSVRVIYRCPPGTKGAYLAMGSGSHDPECLTKYWGENEYLLPRGTTYKILSVTKRPPGGGYKYDVVAEIVEQPHNGVRFDHIPDWESDRD